MSQARVAHFLLEFLKTLAKLLSPIEAPQNECFSRGQAFHSIVRCHRVSRPESKYARRMKEVR